MCCNGLPGRWACHGTQSCSRRTGRALSQARVLTRQRRRRRKNRDRLRCRDLIPTRRRWIATKATCLKARRSHVVVSHVLTKLTSETNSYADEVAELLESLTWERRDPLKPVAGRDELRIRARLRELLVLLKGNDVWVYATDHFKYFPESHEVQLKRDMSKLQMQTVVAFGPPGEYGEETLSVPVDHGQLWVCDPGAPIPVSQ